jgi:hypothetical protein
MFDNFFLLNSCRLWDNVEQCCRVGHAKDGNLARACCMLKATYKHSEYVILIVFPLQQWLHKRASVLRYTYSACFVFFSSFLRTETRLKAVFVDVLSITFRREFCLLRETVGWLGPVSTLLRLRFVQSGSCATVLLWRTLLHTIIYFLQIRSNSHKSRRVTFTHSIQARSLHFSFLICPVDLVRGN